MRKSKKEPPASVVGRTNQRENIGSEKTNDIRFIDLRVDFAFKRVFCTPGNEELLKLLIDGILPDLHVQTLTLGNQENMGDCQDDKKTVFDIKAVTEDGRSHQRS